jgi:hypothetical protein
MRFSPVIEPMLKVHFGLLPIFARPFIASRVNSSRLRPEFEL